MLLHCFISWVCAGELLVVLKPPSPSPSVDFHILSSLNHLHKKRWLCLYCSSSYWAGVWSLNPPCLLFVPHRNSGWPLGSNPGTGSLMLLVTLRLNQKWRIFEKLFPFCVFLNHPLFTRQRNPGQQLGLSVKTGSSKPISWYLQMRPQGLTFEKKSSKPERFSFSQISIYRDASFIVGSQIIFWMFFSFAIDVIEKVSRFGKRPHLLQHFFAPFSIST